MHNFDWQTEEDETLWAAEPPPAPEPPRKLRRWLFLLIAAVALLGAGLAIGREVNQRVKETQEAIKQDVLAADTLARTAAADGDSEVLVTLLSGRDPSWTVTQGEMLDAGLLYGRSAIPFGLEPLPAPPANITVTLASDLNEATVTGTQVYTVQTPAGAESVSLEQTWIYRQGRRNWLLSPPTDEFWGGWDTVAGEFSTVVYPLRDEEFAVAFAADLDAGLRHFCAQSGLDCPADLRMNVRLETDPEALLSLTDPLTMLTGRDRLELPAPSLVGLPADDAAYDALVRGYIAQVLTAAVGEIAGWECCDHLLYFQALVNQILTDQGWLPWPMDPIAYQDLVDVQIDTVYFREQWEVDQIAAAPPLAPQLVQALVAFQVDLGSEPADLFSALVDPPQNGNLEFTHWLVDHGQRHPEGFGAAWRDFIRLQVEAYQVARPLAADIPAATPLLFCSQEESTAILRYWPESDTWAELARLDKPFAIGSGLQDGRGLIYSAGDLSGEVVTSTYWPVGGDPRPVAAPREGDMIFYLGQYLGQGTDPQGTQLPLWVFTPAQNSGLDFAILDLNTCTPEGTCQPTIVPGQPVWSPDGTRIVLEKDEGILLIGDREGTAWTSLGPGRSPVWLDNQTIAHLDNPGGRLQLTRVDEEGSPTLFRADDLDDLLPYPRERFTLTMRVLFAHPARPDTILILASTGLSNDMFMFALRRDPQQPSFLAAAQNDALTVTPLFDSRPLNYSLPESDFSADGRRFVMRTMSGELLLQDLETGDTVHLAETSEFFFRQYAWSPGADWLAFVGVDYLELIHVAEDNTLTRYFSFQEEWSCAAVTWAAPEFGQ